MYRIISRFRSSDSGTMAVMFAASVAALLAFIGLSITFLDGHRNRSTAQMSIDAGVLGAAALADDITDETRVAAAARLFEGNFKAATRSSLDMHNVEIEIWRTNEIFPNGSTIVTRGRVTMEVDNYFAGFAGDPKIKISAESAARRLWSAPVCVLALHESAPNGFEIYGNAEFNAPTCAAQANSANDMGMRTYGKATAVAADFGVQGKSSGDGFAPRPIEGVSPTLDPYASVPFPLIEDCVDIRKKLQQTVTTLSPGTYCGGLDLKAQSEVTLAPGIYIMKDGPLDVNSNTRLFGRDVLIAFTGKHSTLYLGSGAIVDLTSPQSGPWANIQFYQDRDGTNEDWVTILGDVELTFDGAAYFRGKDVWIGGGSVINANSPSYSLVADRFWFQDSSRINITQENRRGLDIEPAERMERGVVLIN